MSMEEIKFSSLDSANEDADMMKKINEHEDLKFFLSEAQADFKALKEMEGWEQKPDEETSERQKVAYKQSLEKFAQEASRLGISAENCRVYVEDTVKRKTEFAATDDGATYEATPEAAHEEIAMNTSENINLAKPSFTYEEMMAKIKENETLADLYNEIEIVEKELVELKESEEPSQESIQRKELALDASRNAFARYAAGLLGGPEREYKTFTMNKLAQAA